ncbi:MAG: PEP-CTERM sorting domain-containing protein [Desulfobacteraceae bacterium]
MHSITTFATLIDRGAGLIYDDDLDVTWLNIRYSTTCVYPSTGGMYCVEATWDNSMAWAESLEYYDEIRDVVWDDWRLPRMPENPISVFSYDGSTDMGYNNINSELSHLYYIELGNVGWFDSAGQALSNWGWENMGPFFDGSTIPYNHYYWIGTTFVEDPSKAWYFGHAGIQDVKDKGIGGFYGTAFAIALRDGDVGDSTQDLQPIPEPGTIFLYISGLVFWGGYRLRRRKKQTGNNFQECGGTSCRTCNTFLIIL